MSLQPELPLAALTASRSAAAPHNIRGELSAFREFGTETQVVDTTFEVGSSPLNIPTYINEFWTAKQRQASSLHEISYRACFKPQLPKFFIERLTDPGDLVYDPFMGRGTTLVETALLGRVPIGCDINPLSQVMVGARLRLPELPEVESRLAQIDLEDPADEPEHLLVFYHGRTLRAISSLKNYFQRRRERNELDHIDLWLEMVSLNRLTGHSNGFFSVYTMPPNQAVSVKSQIKINERRKQTPPERDVTKIILKKSRQLLKGLNEVEKARIREFGSSANLITGPAHDTPTIANGSVSLVVTSPPFLNVVDYANDNWLRCWFLGFDAQSVQLTTPRRLDQWAEAMTKVFQELNRVLKPGGHVAFEVGEVKGGSVNLEETVVPCGLKAGLMPELILINAQEFTKTANCWGVDNNAKGTNTNRIVLFQKP